MIDNWLEKFKLGWEKQDPQAVIKLFDQNVKYYESALEDPTDYEGMCNLWKIVPDNQKDVKFSYELIAKEGDLAVINWKVLRTVLPSANHQKIDGIFLIKLNSEGLCTLFKQWRTTKD